MGAQIAVRDQQLNGIFLACNRSAVHRRPVPVVFGIAIGTMGNKELYHVSRRFDGRYMQRRVAVSIFGIDICSARKKHFDEFASLAQCSAVCPCMMSAPRLFSHQHPEQ